MAVPLTKRRFRVDEYHRMAEAGILSGDERVELLEGEIIQMSPIGSKHAGCVNRLTHLFSSRLRDRAVVAVQNPIALADDSEPQPDIAILQQRGDFYSTAHPPPENVLLLVEVAETSVEVDRMIKIPLYAKAGVREVWLVLMNDRAIERFRAPSPTGYRSVERLSGEATITPEALPDLSLSLPEILG